MVVVYSVGACSVLAELRVVREARLVVVAVRDELEAVDLPRLLFAALQVQHHLRSALPRTHVLMEALLLLSEQIRLLPSRFVEVIRLGLLSAAGVT